MAAVRARTREANGIKIVNRTAYPTAEVKRLVRQQLRDAEVGDVCVTVRYSSDHHASGWWRAYWYPDYGEDRPQILVRLPKPGITIADYTPYERVREQGRAFPLADWREALVAIAAHEAEHHRQRFVLGETKANGKRRSQVELRCDLAAFRAWRRWREKHPQAEAA